MGFFDLFKNKKTNTGTDPDQPSAIEYVERLLGYMSANALYDITIDSERQLPGNELPANSTSKPPCLPDPQTVINRLKLLADIPMMTLTKPAEGSFEQKRRNLLLTVSARFQDNTEKSVCYLHMRTKNVPAGF